MCVMPSHKEGVNFSSIQGMASHRTYLWPKVEPEH